MSSDVLAAPTLDILDPQHRFFEAYVLVGW